MLMASLLSESVQIEHSMGGRAASWSSDRASQGSKARFEMALSQGEEQTARRRITQQQILVLNQRSNVVGGYLDHHVWIYEEVYQKFDVRIYGI